LFFIIAQPGLYLLLQFPKNYISRFIAIDDLWKNAAGKIKSGINVPHPEACRFCNPHHFLHPVL